MLSKSTHQPMRTVPVYPITSISKVPFRAFSERNQFKLHYKFKISSIGKYSVAPGVGGPMNVAGLPNRRHGDGD